MSDIEVKNGELKKEDLKDDKKIQHLTYVEYKKLFPSDRREYWKIFRAKGAIDSRKIEQYGCNCCFDKIFENKEKIKFVLTEGKLTGVKLDFEICIDDVERTIYEVNAYLVRLGFKGQKRKCSAEEREIEDEKKKK